MISSVESITIDSQIPTAKQIAARINKYPSCFKKRERQVGLSPDRELQNSLRFRTKREENELLEEMEKKHGMALVEEDTVANFVEWSIGAMVDVVDIGNFLNDLGLNGVQVTVHQNRDYQQRIKRRRKPSAQ
jgi:hypothetical protein